MFVQTVSEMPKASSLVTDRSLGERLAVLLRVPRLGCLLLVASASPAASAFAQYTPPPPPLTSAPCVPTKKEPCPAQSKSPDIPSVSDKFPFPGEEAPASGATTSRPGVPAPGAPAPQADAAGKFPFPGEPEAPSAGSSSSSSAAPSSPDADAPDSPDSPDPSEPDAGNGAPAKSTRTSRRRLPKVEDLSHREAEDLDISRYYTSTGNHLAAYLRAKDAAATIPDDPEAHYALATTAARLHKNDEAIAEYDAFLKLDPDNDKSKAARKALAALKPR